MGAVTFLVLSAICLCVWRWYSSQVRPAATYCFIKLKCPTDDELYTLTTTYGLDFHNRGEEDVTFRCRGGREGKVCKEACFQFLECHPGRGEALSVLLQGLPTSGRPGEPMRGGLSSINGGPIPMGNGHRSGRPGEPMRGGSSSINGASQGPTPRSHNHRFQRRSDIKKGFDCDACGEAGFGPRYLCMLGGCREDMHVECRVRAPVITHELFNDSTFTFIDQRHGSFQEFKVNPCKVCGQSVERQFYHEDKKKKMKNDKRRRNMHPYCAHIKRERWASNTNLILKEKASSRCVWCNKKSVTENEDGWSYEYQVQSNKCSIHVHCVMVMAQAAWKDGTSGNPVDDAVTTAATRFRDLSRKKTHHGGIPWDVVKTLVAGLLKIVLSVGAGPHGGLLLANDIIQTFF